MKRKIYTTPRTELFRVELEGTFASSATGTDVNVQDGIVTTTGQETAGIDFSQDEWNNGVWE